jgi:hypothetical protein
MKSFNEWVKEISESKKVQGTGNDLAYLKMVFTKKEIEEMPDETKKVAARAIGLARNEGRLEFRGLIRRRQKQRIADYLNELKKGKDPATDPKTGLLRSDITDHH